MSGQVERSQRRAAHRGATGVPGGTPAVTPTEVHQLAAQNETNRLLKELVSRENLDLQQIAVTNGPRRLRKMKDWPMPGASRFLVSNPGNGLSVAPPASLGGVSTLVAENSARLGGLITVSGAPAILYLCSLEIAQMLIAGSGPLLTPQILVPGSGSWNFLLGRVIWGGQVQAVSPTSTAATIYVAEF